MLVMLAVLLTSAGFSEAAISARCSSQPKEPLSLTKDNVVEGRYVVEYCAAAESTSPPVEWVLRLYTTKHPMDQCTYEQLKDYLDYRFTDHSGSNENITITDIMPTNTSGLNSSCPYVCVSKAMDLMYSSCYQLQSYFMKKKKSNNGFLNSEPYITYYFANNSLKMVKSFNETVDCVDGDQEVICNWLEGQIPKTEYEVYLNSADEKAPTLSEEHSVKRNCSWRAGVRGAGTLRCVLRVAPGNYSLTLEHTAPWTRGFSQLSFHTHTFEHVAPTPLAPPTVERTHRALWAGCGALLLGVLSSLAGVLVYRHRQRAKMQFRTLQNWRAGRAEPQALEPEEPAGPVLLLYARDCPPALQVAAALKTLLEERAPGKVFDLYSPTVRAVSAPSPAAFVRECVSEPRVRILLIQTPALAALHTTRLADLDTLTLEAPLLPRRVLYKSPQHADSMLQYALQLLQDAAHAQPAPPYRKYFLATISSLEVEVFPTLVPYTRYELPATVPALLDELFPARGGRVDTGPLTAGACAPVAAACAALVDYVRDNPNYLADQLVFL